MPDISELDFTKNRDNLKAFLSSQDRFKDYDFEGSNMAVLLDLLSYNTYLNNFYANMLFGEMFLDSSQLEESVRSHAKHLNYLPRSRRSAKATCTMTFSANNLPARITIPKFQLVTGRGSDNSTFIFSTDKAYVVEPVGGIYRMPGVELYEGRIITERLEVTADSRFVLANKNIDTDSIEVTVFETDNNASNSKVYSYRSDLFGLTPSDHVFFLRPHGTEQYQLQFGSNIFGVQPVVGNVVQVRYRVTGGESANGVDTFAAPVISGYTATVSGVSPAAGGAEKESVEDIKFFAPKALQIQERAITSNDYRVLLRQRFPEISAVSVFGGEEVSPPQFGRVIVVVKIDGRNYITENQRSLYRNYLKERATITVEPVIELASDIYLSVVGTVYYDASKSGMTASQLKTAAIEKILDFSEKNLETFDVTFRHSKLLSAIDSVESSISSSTMLVKPIIEIVPSLNQNISSSLDFGNALKQSHPIYANENLHTRNTAIRSSKFSIEGRNCFMVDDGNGTLKAFSSLPDGSFATVVDNAGTVDYSTGKVEISTLTVSSYEGSAIKFYATPANSDIISPRRKIMSIRPEDLAISVSRA